MAGATKSQARPNQSNSPFVVEVLITPYLYPKPGQDGICTRSKGSGQTATCTYNSSSSTAVWFFLFPLLIPGSFGLVGLWAVGVFVCVLRKDRRCIQSAFYIIFNSPPLQSIRVESKKLWKFYRVLTCIADRYHRYSKPERVALLLSRPGIEQADSSWSPLSYAFLPEGGLFVFVF